MTDYTPPQVWREDCEQLLGFARIMIATGTPWNGQPTWSTLRQEMRATAKRVPAGV